MAGVEILSTTEVITETTSNWWFAGCVFLLVVVIGGIVGYYVADRPILSLEGIIIGCLIGAIVGLLAWLVIAGITSTPIAYETQHKVTIDESVSMVEFLDKYEILDQEGKIYTVKERE